jgi:hypothetical protein
MSRLRLFASYSAMAAVLFFAAWFALGSFPLLGQTQVRTAGDLAPMTAFPLQQRILLRPSAPSRVSTVPIPADPHEPVTGGVHVAATPADRAAALSLLERAMQPAKLHMPGTPPFRFDVSFNAGGNVRQTGPGELTEIWLSVQKWRWTASLGGSSIVRISSGGQIVEEKHVSEIPMRAQMLRNAIFWAAWRQAPSNSQIRTAEVRWNNKPVTCLLTSMVAGPEAQSPSRLWEEQEFCIDPASGTLQVYSLAPGTYTVYQYGKNPPFHDRLLPEHITIYVGGSVAADANFSITDANPADESLLGTTPEMAANGPVITAMLPSRFPIDIPGGSTSGAIQPVIVHAEIGPDGNVIEEELSAASDPALAERALDAVRGMRFPALPLAQRQVYINVRFLPPEL